MQRQEKKDDWAITKANTRRGRREGFRLRNGGARRRGKGSLNTHERSSSGFKQKKRPQNTAYVRRRAHSAAALQKQTSSKDTHARAAP